MLTKNSLLCFVFVVSWERFYPHKNRFLGKRDIIIVMIQKISSRRVELNASDVNRYAFVDMNRNYTRSLISTDHQSYTLALLCWNPGASSRIHDHPCDGCWMRVIHGQVRELLYKNVDVDAEEGTTTASAAAAAADDHCVVGVGSGTCGGGNYGDAEGVITPSALSSSSSSPLLQCTCQKYYGKGDVAFINDFMGYHQISNASSSTTEHAITLHLYCPPFVECRTWGDANSIPLMATIGYDSSIHASLLQSR